MIRQVCFIFIDTLVDLGGDVLLGLDPLVKCHASLHFPDLLLKLFAHFLLVCLSLQSGNPLLLAAFPTVPRFKYLFGMFLPLLLLLPFLPPRSPLFLHFFLLDPHVVVCVVLPLRDHLLGLLLFLLLPPLLFELEFFVFLWVEFLGWDQAPPIRLFHILDPILIHLLRL